MRQVCSEQVEPSALILRCCVVDVYFGPPLRRSNITLVNNIKAITQANVIRAVFHMPQCYTEAVFVSKGRQHPGPAKKRFRVKKTPLVASRSGSLLAK